METNDIYQEALRICRKIIPIEELAEKLSRITANIEYLESEPDGWYSEKERNLNIAATLLVHYTPNIRDFLRESLTKQNNGFDGTVQTIFDTAYAINTIARRKVLDVDDLLKQYEGLKNKVVPAES